jgi:hypothetical protein
VDVTPEGESCTGDIILDTNQHDAFKCASDISSVISDITVVDCEVTTDACDSFLQRLILKKCERSHAHARMSARGSLG